MNPKWAFVFYMVAIACFLRGSIHVRGRVAAYTEPLGWVAFGLALAVVPLAWGAGVAGW